MPRRLPEHRRPQRRARVRLRRGAPPHRGLRGARRALRRSREPVRGHGLRRSEAPRGLLYHRYRIDADGTILDAKIVPPTSQNQLAIEDDLRGGRRALRPPRRRRPARLCEQAIRNYDPCISCATHFLTLEVERRVTGRRDRRRQRVPRRRRRRARRRRAARRAASRRGRGRPCEQEPSRLIDAWKGARAAVVVDAVASGAEPGTLHRFDASADPVPARTSSARRRTRSASARRWSSRARSARLPTRIVVFGVEGEEFAAGEGLTHPVEAAVEPAVGRSWRNSSACYERRSRARASADERRAAEDRGGRRVGGATRVTRVGVRLGALSHFTPDHFRSTSRTPRAGRWPRAPRSTLPSTTTSRPSAPATSCSRASRSRSPSRRCLMCLGSIAVLGRELGGRGRAARPARRRQRRPALVRPRRATRAHLLVHLGIPVEVLEPTAAREALALRAGPTTSASRSRCAHARRSQRAPSASRSPSRPRSSAGSPST